MWGASMIDHSTHIAIRIPVLLLLVEGFSLCGDETGAQEAAEHQDSGQSRHDH
jgi:hypothetical protein